MKAVILLSGGLDSSSMLPMFGRDSIALTVMYGQRHARELRSAEIIAGRFGIRHEVVEMPIGLMGGSSLTGGDEVPDGHYEDESMLATVVPARNTVLLASAAAVACRDGFDAIAYAAHSGDRAIYPDCRLEFIRAFSGVLEHCWHSPVRLLTPFSEKSKADIVSYGHSSGVPLGETWSCYKGGDIHCGACGTCTERREAFAVAGIIDPTVYEKTPPVIRRSVKGLNK